MLQIWRVNRYRNVKAGILIDINTSGDSGCGSHAQRRIAALIRTLVSAAGLPTTWTSPALSYGAANRRSLTYTFAFNAVAIPRQQTCLLILLSHSQVQCTFMSLYFAASLSGETPRLFALSNPELPSPESDRIRFIGTPHIPELEYRALVKM